MSQAFAGQYSDGNPNPLNFALEKPWETIIPKWLRTRGLLVDGDPQLDRLWSEMPEEHQWVEWMRPFVEASPIPIITVFDWLWWVTYACKYQHDLLRIYYNRAVVSEELRESVINFYEGADFDQWSFHNHESK